MTLEQQWLCPQLPEGRLGLRLLFVLGLAFASGIGPARAGEPAVRAEASGLETGAEALAGQPVPGSSQEETPSVRDRLAPRIAMDFVMGLDLILRENHDAENRKAMKARQRESRRIFSDGVEGTLPVCKALANRDASLCDLPGTATDQQDLCRFVLLFGSPAADRDLSGCGALANPVLEYLCRQSVSREFDCSRLPGPYETACGAMIRALDAGELPEELEELDAFMAAWAVALVHGKRSACERIPDPQEVASCLAYLDRSDKGCPKALRPANPEEQALASNGLIYASGHSRNGNLDWVTVLVSPYSGDATCTLLAADTDRPEAKPLLLAGPFRIRRDEWREVRVAVGPEVMGLHPRVQCTPIEGPSALENPPSPDSPDSPSAIQNPRPPDSPSFPEPTAQPRDSFHSEEDVTFMFDYWRAHKPGLKPRSFSDLSRGSGRTGDADTVGKTLATVGDFRRCVDVGQCSGANFYTKSTDPRCHFGAGDDLLMNCVSHAGATEYCRFAGSALPQMWDWLARAEQQDVPRRSLYCDAVCTTGYGDEDFDPEGLLGPDSGKQDAQFLHWEWVERDCLSEEELREAKVPAGVARIIHLACTSTCGDIRTMAGCSGDGRHPDIREIHSSVRCVAIPTKQR